jgi:hypothetical protein
MLRFERACVLIKLVTPLFCVVCFIQAGCGKKAEISAPVEKAEAAKAVRENQVYGEQVKALDKAKEMQKSLDAQTAESTKKLDELTK